MSVSDRYDTGFYHTETHLHKGAVLLRRLMLVFNTQVCWVFFLRYILQSISMLRTSVKLAPGCIENYFFVTVFRILETFASDAIF